MSAPTIAPSQEAGKMPAFLTRARILLVDDEQSYTRVLRRVLGRQGFTELADTSDPLAAADLFRSFRPDLVCLDLHMPMLDGFGVLEQIGPLIPAGTYLPILMLTSDTSPGVKRRALALGAKDFVVKPYDADEVLLRIRNLLEPRFMHLELAGTNQELERLVGERTSELRESRLEVLERLARAAEFRDDATGRHAQRVGSIAGLLARSVGHSTAEVEMIRRAAPLHDIGKIGTPDQVLLKPGKLTVEEFEVMKRHTLDGAQILSGGKTPLIQLAETIARSHHERWDGKGYPDGLGGEAIPLVARCVALADVFDALAHDRPYRPAWPVAQVLDEMCSQAGAHFDPCLLDKFLELPHAELL